jgi:GT2 family glycosyltransferase
MAAELSIIIVNWNTGELLRSCLESVVQYPPSVEYELIVVDNASTDDSAAWLQSGEAARLGDTPVRLIRNTENAGFSRANNQGIAAGDAPMLLLLNPDTEVKPGALDRLIRTLRSDPRIGACGPRLLRPDGSLQASVWRNPPVPWEILVSGLGLHRLLPRPLRGELLLGSHWDHRRRRRVGMLSGAAILARRAMVDQVGGLDERFHLYAEDTEWCLRITRHGWRLLFEPDAVIVHHGSQSSMQRWSSPELVRVQAEAVASFHRLCLPPWHAAANLLAYCLVLSLRQARQRSQPAPSESTAAALQVYRRCLKGW